MLKSMKSWLIFGMGLFLGICLGAISAAFLLDDSTVPPSSPRPAVVAKTKSKPSHPKTSQTTAPQTLSAHPAAVPDNRPVAVTAEGVNPDSLPPEEEDGVISTARTETPPAPHSTQ